MDECKNTCDLFVDEVQVKLKSEFRSVQMDKN